MGDSSKDAEITALKAELQKLKDKVSAGIQKSKPKTKFADPKLFDGTRDKFREFETALKLKIQGDKHIFEDEDDKVLYAVNRLEKAPTEWAKLFYACEDESKKLKYKDFKDWLSQLKSACGNPNEKRETENKLSNLRQAGRPVATYYAEY